MYPRVFFSLLSMCQGRRMERKKKAAILMYSNFLHFPTVFKVWKGKKRRWGKKYQQKIVKMSQTMKKKVSFNKDFSSLFLSHFHRHAIFLINFLWLSSRIFFLLRSETIFFCWFFFISFGLVERGFVMKFGIWLEFVAWNWTWIWNLVGLGFLCMKLWALYSF